MEQAGKWLVGAGLLLALVGTLVWVGVLRWLRLGRLPGDIAVQKDGFAIYFPITTMILLSVIVTGVAWLIGRVSR